MLIRKKYNTDFLIFSVLFDGKKSKAVSLKSRTGRIRLAGL